MYPVSEEFKNKILSSYRRVFGKVQIDYTDPFLDQSIVITANENANVSYPEQVGDNVSKSVGKIASLDGSWNLSDNYRLAPLQDELAQMGWWGKQLSNVSGNFSNPYPTLTLTFVSRPIIRLKVTGDNNRLEYPVDFKIRLYSASDTLLYTETITGNNNVTWLKELSSPITQVIKMELEITKWSHPGRQTKIVEFYTLVQEVYEGEDLFSINLIEQRENGNNSLPIGNVAMNEISVSLNNVDRRFDEGNTQSPLYNLLKANRRIKAWIGIEKDNKEKEYVPLGTFWCEDWTAANKTITANTKGQDRLKFLVETQYSTIGIPSNVSLYDLAVDVLTDAGVSPEEYWVDPELANIIIPFVKIDKMSHRDMLRLISEVSLGQVYCDRNGTIKVEGSVSASAIYNVSVSEQANISYPLQLTDGIEKPDGLFASLDGSWDLSGDYELAPEVEGKQMGWWAKQLSDSNRYFISPYPKATLTFLSKAISTVKLVGDSIREEYPVDFDISVYDSDDVLLSKQVVVGNVDMSPVVVIPENPTNAVRIDVEIKRWSHPNRQAKLLELKDILYIQHIPPNQCWDKDNPVKYSELINYVEIETNPINASGEELSKTKLVFQDEESIVENGLRKYSFPNNPLVQTSETAISIGTVILETFKNPNRNLELDWRGNPALLLGDMVSVLDNKEINNYKIVKQELDFDGAFRAKLTGRKAID